MANAMFEELKGAIGKRAQKEVATTLSEKWAKAHPQDPPGQSTWVSQLSRATQGNPIGLNWFFGDGAAKGAMLLDELAPAALVREAIVAAAQRRLHDAARTRYRFVVDVAAIAAPKGFQKFVEEEREWCQARRRNSYSYGGDESFTVAGSVQAIFASLRGQIAEAPSTGRTLFLVTPEFEKELTLGLVKHERADVRSVADANVAADELRAEVVLGAIAITRGLEGLPLKQWVECWPTGGGAVSFEPSDWAKRASEPDGDEPDAEATTSLADIADALGRANPGAKQPKVSVSESRDSSRWEQPFVGVFVDNDIRWRWDPAAVKRTLASLFGDEAIAATMPWPVRLKLAEHFGGKPVSTADEREIAAAVLHREAIVAAAEASGGVKPVARGKLDLALARARRRGETVTFDVGSEWHFAYPVDLPKDIAASPLVKVHDWPRRKLAIDCVREAADGWTEHDWRRDPQLELLVARLSAEGGEERELVHAAATLLRAGALHPKAEPATRAEPLEALRGVLAARVDRASVRLPLEARGRIVVGTSNKLIGPSPVPLVLERGTAAFIGKKTDWKLPDIEKPETCTADWLAGLEEDEQKREFKSGDRPYVAEPLADKSWAYLDNQLAFALLALRRGLDRSELLAVGGRLLVELGGGVFADLTARKLAPGANERPSFMFQASESHFQTMTTLDLEEFKGHGFSGSSGVEVPIKLILDANGWSVDVHFVRSGLHVAASRTLGAFSMNAMAQEHDDEVARQAREEEERRRREQQLHDEWVADQARRQQEEDDDY